MTVPFKNIPSALRTPLFFAELDPSRANTNQRPQRALLIGQKTAAGTLVPNVPVISQSETNAVAAAGAGSVLAGMAYAYRLNDPTGEMWLLPLLDDPAAVAATGTITFTGSVTSSGTLALYIAGHALKISLAAASTAAQVAAIVVTAITAAPNLPVTATAAAGVVTLTAKNGGLLGNDIDMRLNYAGAAGGEATPAGLGVAFAAMTGGATNPSLVTALGNLQDNAFDFIVCSLTDTTSMAAIAALLNDVNGRWAWSTQVYGHCFIASRGTAGTLAAYATGLNNQHVSCVGFNDSPSPSWKWAASFAGAAAVSLRADPGLPLQTLTVAGILPPPLASRFPLTTRNATLLYSGVSTFTVDASGAVAIERLITTYVTNPQGQPDDSYLSVERLYLLMFILRRLRDVVTTNYARVKLAADGTRVLPGTNVVTPSIIRGDLIAAYRQLEAEGMVQNSAAFAAGVVVEKDATTPGRVNVLWPGILIEQLNVFALLAQFRNS